MYRGICFLNSLETSRRNDVEDQFFIEASTLYCCKISKF